MIRTLTWLFGLLAFALCASIAIGITCVVCRVLFPPESEPDDLDPDDWGPDDAGEDIDG